MPKRPAGRNIPSDRAYRAREGAARGPCRPVRRMGARGAVRTHVAAPPHRPV